MQYRPVLVSQRTAQLRSNRRLVLVFDIDHTLLHATRDPMAVFYRQHPVLRTDTHSFRVEGDSRIYTVKLRPGGLAAAVAWCGGGTCICGQWLRFQK